MDFTSRFVALGDSFTEGVGDDDPTRPNGVRGWADRVAEQLCAADPDFGYANREQGAQIRRRGGIRVDRQPRQQRLEQGSLARPQRMAFAPAEKRA